MTFQELGLNPEIMRAVSEKGYTEPTNIQTQAIPVLLKGSDIMALAPTGTGKTAAFTIPILQLLNSTAQANVTRRVIRALILTPTRELAAQVGESVRDYGKHLKLRSEIIFGGVNINPQIAKLERGTDIVIATPGRLLDLVNQRVVDLSKVEILVLDEADRMLDMGFVRDVKKIIGLLPRKKQSMLFSATLSSDIQAIADSLLHNPKTIEVAKRNITTTLVQQLVYPVDKKRKRELLSFLIGSKNWKQVLVFTRTKHGANNLCEQLTEDGLTAAAIHGNKSQGARTRALADFKSGKIRILVATDIAARGIDIDQLPYVVNYDLPNVPEDYVHRIGRTGRAGNTGIAISLVCIDDQCYLKDIERVIKNTIPKEIFAGYEPDPSIKAEPKVKIQRRRTSDFQPNSRPSDRTSDRSSRPADRTFDRSSRPADSRTSTRTIRQSDSRTSDRSSRPSDRTFDRSSRPADRTSDRSNRPADRTSDRSSRPSDRTFDRSSRPSDRTSDRSSRPANRTFDRSNGNVKRTTSYSKKDTISNDR